MKFSKAEMVFPCQYKLICINFCSQFKPQLQQTITSTNLLPCLFLRHNDYTQHEFFYLLWNYRSKECTEIVVYFCCYVFITILVIALWLTVVPHWHTHAYAHICTHIPQCCNLLLCYLVPRTKGIEQGSQSPASHRESGPMHTYLYACAPSDWQVFS